MPAPLGNQYAIGNQGGRPRIHKRDELAKKLDGVKDLIQLI